MQLSVSVSLLHRQTECRFPLVTSSVAAACDLPVHQAQSVDVGALEGIKVLHVDGLVQDLWSHVPARGHKFFHVITKTKKTKKEKKVRP